jgi:hypothetical protein
MRQNKNNEEDDKRNDRLKHKALFLHCSFLLSPWQ